MSFRNWLKCHNVVFCSWFIHFPKLILVNKPRFSLKCHNGQQLFRLLLVFILFISMSAIISLSGNLVSGRKTAIKRHFRRKRHVLIINYSINHLKSKNLGPLYLKCHYIYTNQRETHKALIHLKKWGDFFKSVWRWNTLKYSLLLLENSTMSS